MRSPLRLTCTLLAAVAVVGAIPSAPAAAEAAVTSDMLRPGDPFPDFELRAHDGTTVRSDDLSGTPFLLYYYPKADTPGCTVEAQMLRDASDEIEAAGFEVYGVSYDAPEENRAFAEKYDLPFRLLSDPDAELAREVGAWRETPPVPKRISFLVDADGRVLKTYPVVDPATHAGEVIEDYRALTSGEGYDEQPSWVPEG